MSTHSFHQSPWNKIRPGRLAHIPEAIPIRLPGPSLRGFPAIASLERYWPAEPETWNSPDSPPEVEFSLWNIQGQPLRWLERKLTDKDWEEIQKELLAVIHQQQQDAIDEARIARWEAEQP